MNKSRLPKIDSIFGDYGTDKEKKKAEMEKKMNHFPVKYCPECKRCYEGPSYLPGFPTIALRRIPCKHCREKKNGKNT